MMDKPGGTVSRFYSASVSSTINRDNILLLYILYRIEFLKDTIPETPR